MKESKCPKCESTEFEMVSAKIKGTKYKHKFCQCSSCGAIIGMLEENSIAGGIDTILANMQGMEARINQQFIQLRFQR